MCGRGRFSAQGVDLAPARAFPELASGHAGEDSLTLAGKNHPVAPMTELLVYAPGLREGDKQMQLSHQMDMLAARFKVDAAHDMVYFEIDDPDKITLRQVNDLFEHIGLKPRFVGSMPEAMKRGDVTEKLVR